MDVTWVCDINITCLFISTDETVVEVEGHSEEKMN